MHGLSSMAPHGSAASRARSLSPIAAVLGRFSSELAALGVGHDGVMLMVLQGQWPRVAPALAASAWCWAGGTQVEVDPVLGRLGPG